MKLLDFLLGTRKTYPKPEKRWTVTVLVPAYNEEASIRSTVRSIQAQTYPVDRILVIDDCSTDETRELALIQGAEVITTSKQTGTKAQAQNSVLDLVTTDIIVTIDGDTVLAPDAIEEILPPLADSNVASVCGFVIPQVIKNFWQRARYIEYLYGISVIKETQSNWNACMVSSGCFSAYRTDLLKKFGGFPPRSVVEDMDLTWTQLEQGYSVVMSATARCYPVDPYNYATYRGQVERWQRGLFQVISLHGKELFKCKRLAFFVGWGLVEGIFSPLPLLAMIPLMYHGNTMGTGLLVTTLIGVGIVTVASIIEAQKEDCTWLALTSVPCYFLISLINMYLFWKSFILECILHKHLTEWEKGH